MNGLIGKKIGMTSIFDQAGNNVACTVIDASPNVVTQVKSEDEDGYSSVQLAYGDKKEKNTSNAMIGHFKKANATPKRKVVEFRNFNAIQKVLGDEITIQELFEVGDFVDVSGTSKGKGFQGVVKRYNFKGVNDTTHGQHNRQRAPGSIGAASTPSKVVKGMRMAGRTGGKTITKKNLEVLKIFPDENLLLIKGAVPGHKGSFVVIQK